MVERVDIHLKELVRMIGDVCTKLDQECLSDAGIFEAVFDHNRSTVMLELAAEVNRNGTLKKSLKAQKSKVRSKLRRELATRLPNTAAIDELLLRIELVSALGTGLAINHLLSPEALPDSVLDMANKIASELFNQVSWQG